MANFAFDAAKQACLALVWSLDQIDEHARLVFDHYDVISLKDLNKVWRSRLARDAGMSKHNTLIVEDTRENCFKNYGNAIYVRTFNAFNQDDDVLNFLIWYVRRLAKKPTVRTIEKRGWYTRMLLDDTTFAVATESEEEERTSEEEEENGNTT